MKKKHFIWTSILLIIMAFTYYFSYKFNIKDIDTNILIILENNFKREKDEKVNIDLVSSYIKYLKGIKHFKEREKEETKEVSNIVYNTNEAIVYIYNTHSDEEYSYQKNDLYNITPTVKTASYILEDELKKLGINSIVESKKTIDIVNERNLAYSDSYKVSRELMEEQKLKNNSLIYFIDLHRDSVKKNLTTTKINDISYAKVMFLLGLENKNYIENKKVISSMNDFLNENYRGLSRGIYEKKGKGVNGVYNQDFNANTILIEVGGVDNTIDEVSNSLKVIANMLYNYINLNK